MINYKKLKRVVTTTMLLMMLTMFSVSYVGAEDSVDTQINGIILKINEPVIYTANYLAFQGVYLDDIGTVPITKDGRAYIPASPIIQKLGGTVDWDGKTQSVTITLDNSTVVLTVNSKKAVVDGYSVNVSAAPINHKGKVMLPLRVLTEGLDLELEWDNKNQVVSIFRPFFKSEMATVDMYQKWYAYSDVNNDTEAMGGLDFYQYAETIPGQQIEVGDIVSKGMFYGEVKEIKGTQAKVFWEGKNFLIPDGDEEFWAIISDVKYKMHQWVELSELTLEN